MADELHCEQDLQPLLVVDYPPNARSRGQSKAKFMCDHNFAGSRRQQLGKVRKILQGREAPVLMAQDPSVVFEVMLWSGRLERVYDSEQEILSNTWRWFTRKFRDFDINKYGQSSSLMECLTIWINSYLRPKLDESRRWLRNDALPSDSQRLEIRYLQKHYKKEKVKDPKTGKIVIDPKTGKPKERWTKIIADGTTINEDGEETTLLDLIDENGQTHSSRSRSAIHRSLADKPTKAVCGDVMKSIKNDPEGRLREIYLESNPAVNAYEILYRMHIRYESLAGIVIKRE
jgi:hypothetical protein